MTMSSHEREALDRAIYRVFGTTDGRALLERMERLFLSVDSVLVRASMARSRKALGMSPLPSSIPDDP